LTTLHRLHSCTPNNPVAMEILCQVSDICNTGKSVRYLVIQACPAVTLLMLLPCMES
jgi:hypothetical protein